MIFWQQSENPCRRSKPAPLRTPRRRSHPNRLLSQDPQCHLRIAGKTTPKPAIPHPAENMFVEDLTSVPEQAHWNCVRKGKIHVLQCCALSGLKVGTRVDIRTGFDEMTSKGRHMVTEIIREQAPDVILMAPVCGPWSYAEHPTRPTKGRGKAETLSSHG